MEVCRMSHQYRLLCAGQMDVRVFGLDLCARIGDVRVMELKNWPRWMDLCAGMLGLWAG